MLSSGRPCRQSAANRSPVRVPASGKRPGGKVETILTLLQRPEGARLPELEKATGWQPHSVRAALTGLRKRGIEVTRERKDDVTTYYAKAA